jgi:hypothetical protein
MLTLNVKYFCPIIKNDIYMKEFGFWMDRKNSMDIDSNKYITQSNI